MKPPSQGKMYRTPPKIIGKNPLKPCIIFPSHPSITVVFPAEIDTIQMSFDRWLVENDLFNVPKNEDVDWQPSDVTPM